MVFQDLKTKNVAVGSAEVVTARIEFALAQPNGWSAKLTGRDPITGQDEETVPLGSGAELKGKVFQVVAHMVDAQPATNLLLHRVRIVHPGGQADVLEFTNPGGGPGDSAVYTSLFLFV